VWDDPNLPTSWHGGPDPAGYARFLKSTAAVIKAADPRAKVVLGELADGRSGRRPASFLRGLYRIKGVKRSFDVVALQPRSIGPKGVARLLRGVRKAMKKGHDSRTPVWITRIGFPTGSTAQMSSVAPVPHRRAERLRRLYAYLVRRHVSYRLGMISWISLRDRRRYPRERTAKRSYTGLVSRIGTPKPAWSALLRITGGSNAFR
jgi:hypothetical protein